VEAGIIPPEEADAICKAFYDDVDILAENQEAAGKGDPHVVKRMG